jgi:hypothetical protein
VKGADLAAPDYQECTYGSKDNADDEERRKDGLWSQNRLPCFQSLLLESRIYVRGVGERRTFAQLEANALAGRFQLPFSFLGSSVESDAG